MYFKILTVVVFLLTVTGIVVLRNVDDILNQSSEPLKADYIVCLAFSNARVDRAVSLLNEGYGEKIVATTSMTYASLLKRHVDKNHLILLTPDAKTTYQEGELLSRQLKNGSALKVLVVSDALHLYRVRWTMGHFFKDSPHQFSYVASAFLESSSTWWKDRQKRQAVLYEVPAILYYWFAHGLWGIEDDPGWKKKMKKKYVGLIAKYF